MIRGLAFVENVIRDLKVEIASHEMLANVRRAQRRFIRHLEAILSFLLLLKIFSFHHEVDTSPSCVVVSKLHKKIAEVLHEFVKGVIYFFCSFTCRGEEEETEVLGQIRS